MIDKNTIHHILTEAFHPIQLVVEDQSALHAGHAEAVKSGGGHYSVAIVSELFEGKNLTQRHRLVYAALKNEMTSGIHALAITALTPQEKLHRSSSEGS